MPGEGGRGCICHALLEQVRVRAKLDPHGCGKAVVTPEREDMPAVLIHKNLLNHLFMAAKAQGQARPLRNKRSGMRLAKETAGGYWAEGKLFGLGVDWQLHIYPTGNSK